MKCPYKGTYLQLHICKMVIKKRYNKIRLHCEVFSKLFFVANDYNQCTFYAS